MLKNTVTQWCKHTAVCWRVHRTPQGNSSDRHIYMLSLSTWHAVAILATIHLYTISGMRHNILHPVSSLPSVHSRVPSQRSEERIHWLLVHRNAPVPQEAAIGDSNFKAQVKEHGAWIHCELRAKLNNNKTYCSSFHHFHQSMSWSHHIVQRWGYTHHWHTGTG